MISRTLLLRGRRATEMSCAFAKASGNKTAVRAATNTALTNGACTA